MAVSALAQLGIAAFYDADLETARQDLVTALAAATKAGDAGAQIRFLTMLGYGLAESKMYEQALAYIENPINIATATSDAGYQFPAQEVRIAALIGLKQLDTAQRVLAEFLMRARETRRTVHEANALVLAADLAEARNDRQAALAILQQAIDLGESGGLPRVLASVYARAAEIHRESGNLEKAERDAELVSGRLHTIKWRFVGRSAAPTSTRATSGCPRQVCGGRPRIRPCGGLPRCHYRQCFNRTGEDGCDHGI